MIDPKLLTLIEVDRQGGFTSAAKALNLTQPAVSQHIRQLEKELGITIFHKVGGSLKLTAEGENLLWYAKRIASLYNELAASIKDYKRGRKTYVVGITHTAEANLIAEVLAAYASDHPGTKIKIKTDTIKNLYEKLSSYELDLAIVDGPLHSKKYSSILLDTDSLVAVMSKKHPLAHKPVITIEDLMKEPLILRSKQSETRTLFSAALGLVGRSIEEFNVVLELDNIMTIKELVGKGDVVSVLPRSACYSYGDKDLLSLRPIENLNMSREVSIVYQSDFADRQFLDNLVRIYKEKIAH